jgi:hypothetical protein
MSVRDEWKMQCPKCGKDDRILITGTTALRLGHDGTEPVDGYHNWEPSSACRCDHCNFDGIVADFETAYERAQDEREKQSREATAYQFVATYFTSDAAKAIDYGTLQQGLCWNGYVAAVAEAGALLEDVMQEQISQGVHLEEWYEVLDDAADALAGLYAEGFGPDDPAIALKLRPAFTEIIRRHAER